MNPKEKEERITYILNRVPRLSKNGAEELVTIDGIVELLSQETLPPNPNKRPELPISKHPHISEIGRTFRVSLIEYLDFWLQIYDSKASIPSSLPWPAYIALIEYCESKTNIKVNTKSQQ